ncbi:MAG: N-6 DNA methylase [Myxococcales bacterium]|nr:N-6 DNA methylase [Myxococcales bacterium]
MSQSRSAEQRRILQNLTRERRLQAPLLAELRRAFEGGDWLDPGSLGTLYEAHLAEKKSLQRGQGSYFTPPYLVDFVVQQTLSEIVVGRSASEIKSLRILDPSCGGGAFLLGVLGFLERHCVVAGAKAGLALRQQLSACLIGVDLDGDAVEVSRAALQLAVGGACRATLISGDALLPTTRIPTVHAIVGNPPWGQKGLRISEATRKRYRQLFKTARGVWDPFKFFVERAHQLLPVGAPWGFVLPDIVLLKNLQEVRDVVLEGSAITEIAHCGQAFDGANIDAVVICAKRVSKAVGSKHTLRVWPKLEATWKSKAAATHRQPQSVFRELPGHTFNLYLHGPALALYRRLRDLPRLGGAFEMHEGVHTGNVRSKLFVNEKGQGPTRRVIVGGSEMAAYQLSWKGRWLNLAPSAVDRSAGDYANLGRPAWYSRHKIVVRRTGDRVMAALDGQGFYVSNNLFLLLDTNVEREGALAVRFRQAIVALLNSSFMTWYFRAIQPRKGRLFAELKLIHLRDFPLPGECRWRNIEDRLALLERKGRRLGLASVLEQVDALVESAFEISPREREVIRLSQ